MIIHLALSPLLWNLGRIALVVLSVTMVSPGRKLNSVTHSVQMAPTGFWLEEPSRSCFCVPTHQRSRDGVIQRRCRPMKCSWRVFLALCPLEVCSQTMRNLGPGPWNWSRNVAVHFHAFWLPLLRMSVSPFLRHASIAWLAFGMVAFFQNDLSSSGSSCLWLSIASWDQEWKNWPGPV